MKKRLMSVLILWMLVLVGVGSVLAATFEQTVRVTVLPEELQVNAPQEGDVYGDKQVLIDVNIFENAEANQILYSDNGRRFLRLCEKCSSYYGRKRFRKGEHVLTIKAVFDDRDVKRTINFEIDSTRPKIFRWLPQRNSAKDGGVFYIKYTEKNLRKIILFYGNKTDMRNKTKTDCEAGAKKECIFEGVDLSDYNGQWIWYWYEISDFANTVVSEKFKIEADTKVPFLIINSPVEGSVYNSRKVPFNLSIDEEVILEYMDLSNNNPIWRKLCLRDCDRYGFNRKRIRKFGAGVHNLLIRATDRAENSDIKEVNFCVGENCE